MIGHVKKADVKRVERAFSEAAPDAARIVMVHHNPIRGSLSGRHGLANTKQALNAFAGIGAELVLCGHDHLEAVHTVEEITPNLVISTAGTISNRLRSGRDSSFNLVDFDAAELRITTYYWNDSGGFVPEKERTFPRRTDAPSLPDVGPSEYNRAHEFNVRDIPEMPEMPGRGTRTCGAG